MKTLIIDDEPKSRANLKNLISDYCPNIELVGEARDYKEALSLFKRYKPDFIFLDIQMPKMNGLELASVIQEIENIPVIFITAFDHYALKAFKVRAFDYLLKPIKISELQNTVKRVVEFISEKTGVNKIDSENDTDKICLPWKNGFKVIDTNNIVHIESDNSYSSIHFSNGDSLVFVKSIGELEKLLGASRFYRIHNRHIINLDHMDNFTTRDGGLVKMKNGSFYPVSRRKLTDFRQSSKSYFKSLNVDTL